MFHHIVHIADTLLHLRRAGHPQYIEWYQSFACNAVTQNELQELHQQMKDHLQNWLNKVSVLRTKLYELNYFTCLQLLQISNEFYHLISNPDYQLSKDTLLLLMSISSDLTIEDVKSVTSTTEAQSMIEASRLSSECSEEFVDTSEIDIDTETSKLTDEQKKLFSTYSGKEYGFNPSMVLTAIHKFGPNEIEIEDWCLDPKNIRKFGTTPDSKKAKIDHKVKIDVNNETVQELIRCDYSESLAIQAVEQCGEDIAICLEYLIDQRLDKISKDVTSEDQVSSYSDANIYKAQQPNLSSSG